MSVFAAWSRAADELNAVVIVVVVEDRPSESSNLTAEWALSKRTPRPSAPARPSEPQLGWDPVVAELARQGRCGGPGSEVLVRSDVDVPTSAQALNGPDPKRAGRVAHVQRRINLHADGVNIN